MESPSGIYGTPNAQLPIPKEVAGALGVGSWELGVRF
jgi:hypothetical protein